MKYIIRLIVLPAVTVLAVIGLINRLLITLADFMRYGGEFLVMGEKTNDIKHRLDKILEQSENK